MALPDDGDPPVDPLGRHRVQVALALFLALARDKSGSLGVVVFLDHQGRDLGAPCAGRLQQGDDRGVPDSELLVGVGFAGGDQQVDLALGDVSARLETLPGDVLDVDGAVALVGTLVAEPPALADHPAQRGQMLVHVAGRPLTSLCARLFDEYAAQCDRVLVAELPPRDELPVGRRRGTLRRRHEDVGRHRVALRPGDIELSGPLTGIYDPNGMGTMLFAVLAVAAQLDREYILDKTLEGQQAAAAKGNHGGRPKVIGDDMLTFAAALREKGVPMPEIARKLAIKSGRNAGKPPSVASLYRALAEAADSDALAGEVLSLRPVPARITGPGSGTDPELTERLQRQGNGHRS